MVTENKENEKNIVPVTEVKPAVKPKDMSDEQVQSIEASADKAVKALVAAEGAAVFAIEDQVTNVGIKDQKAVSTGLTLLQEKMGNVFQSDGKTGVTDSIAKDIADLQGVLVKINPKDIQKEAIYRVLKAIPFFGNWIVGVLRKSANSRTTLQGFLDHLEESLKNGETMLRQDNAQLRVMYKDLEGKQKLVSSDAYFAEVLMEKLSDAVAEVEDEKKKNSLNKVLFRVATRAQDLRAMENVHEQFFASIEMTRDNNDMLIATVQRMLTLGMQVAYIAFAIYAALKRQQSVLEAEKGTREFLGKMLVNNATMINSHVKDIGDLYKEPVIAMDKLSAAIAQLEQAIDATNRLKAEGITNARDNIVKIKVLTEEIKTKAGTLPEDIRSLEASKTLQLTNGK